MPTLSVRVPHTLGQQQATERLKQRFREVQDQFGQHVSDLEEQWNGHVLRFGFRALGIRVEGTVTSGESEVSVDAGLPLLAMPLKGRIEQQIRAELGKILA
jgi:putative polyhydroxyalkanoate system protein